MPRVAFGITGDLKDELNELKRINFYDKTWSEMYRVLIEAGIKAAKKGK